jgi:hypothetical protein
MEQAVLDLRPPKRAPEERAVNRGLCRALRRILLDRHVGRESAATWEQLLGEVSREGIEVKVVRRLQEAASHLRRVEKLAVGGTSQSGIYVVVDESERRMVAAERVKRIRAEVEELAAFDRALYERVAPLLLAVDGGRE